MKTKWPWLTQNQCFIAVLSGIILLLMVILVICSGMIWNTSTGIVSVQGNKFYIGYGENTYCFKLKDTKPRPEIFNGSFSERYPEGWVRENIFWTLRNDKFIGWKIPSSQSEMPPCAVRQGVLSPNGYVIWLTVKKKDGETFFRESLRARNCAIRDDIHLRG